MSKNINFNNRIIVVKIIRKSKTIKRFWSFEKVLRREPHNQNGINGSIFLLISQILIYFNYFEEKNSLV